jgi:hypothetical protein
MIDNKAGVETTLGDDAGAVPAALDWEFEEIGSLVTNLAPGA